MMAGTRCGRSGRALTAPSSWIALVTALGVGLFLSAVAVRYRDVPYTIPFILQLWLFVSAVAYSISALPEKWQWLLSLNPMTA